MSEQTPLPLGKLPPELLDELLKNAPATDPRVILGPGVGLDCAVLDLGGRYLVFKAEPITFVTSEIGWYAIHIAANDIATTGGTPRWYLATLLLPERRTTPALVEEISRQLFSTCSAMGVSVIGGHTEITYGLDRPILVGTLIGEVEREKLVTPKGALPGDRLLLTKGIPIEATAILAREFPDRLRPDWTEKEIETAQRFLFEPGISVLRDAQIATAAGRVHAMHDPTEGGLAAAVWELAQASDKTLTLWSERVPMPELSARIVRRFGLDPLATIASGALLLAAPEEDVSAIQAALAAENILCAEIGRIDAGPTQVWLETSAGRQLLARPARDEITRVYE